MTESPPYILLAEDEAAHAAAIERAFQVAGSRAELRVVGTLGECQAALASRTPDLLLLDLHFPDGNALTFLAAHSVTAAFPVLAMTSLGNEQTAVEAMKAGALDYIVKTPESLVAMPKAVERGLREWQLRLEHLNALQRVAEAEHQYRTLADSGMGLIWTSGLDKLCNYFNRTWLEFTGRSLEQEMGNGWLEGVHPEDLQRCMGIYSEAFDLRERFSMEYRLRRTDGEYRWIQDDGCPRYDQRGEFLGYLGYCLDITHRKEVEQARLELERQVLHDQRVESLGVLAGGIAHDFNNILTAILGNSELVLNRLDAADPLRKHLENIQIGGRRAKDLVEKILLFSRQIDSRPESLVVASAIEDTVKLLRAVLPSTITMQIDVDTAEAAVLMDPTELHQVVMNLCVNAAHAMREGIMGVLTIAAHRISRQGRDWIELVVGDTGSGIPLEIRSRIFDPFFTTKGIHEGTGLGLSVVHGIIQRAGGSIEVESELGKGSQFHILLPEVIGLDFSRAAKAPVEEGRSHQGHILLVEDEPTIRELLAEAMAHAGYTVEPCADGQEALAKGLSNPGLFDAVISDQTMPRMTGLQLAQALTHSRPGLPFILMTGLASSIDASTLKAAGVSVLLLKPIFPSDLVRALGVLLRASSSTLSSQDS